MKNAMGKVIRNWNTIVNYMDDETREQVHMELAPCGEAEFLNRYCELSPEFAGFLLDELGIDDVG